MAPPPNFKLTRTLVSRYIKTVMPRRADPRPTLESELFSCWGMYGIESEKCRHIETKLDNATSDYLNNSKVYDTKAIITEIKSKLNKPLYRSMTKGRFRDFGQRPYNIYDGIDGLK